MPDAQMGLIFKWNVLNDEMSFDDEVVDFTVGCTVNLFTREPQQCQLIIKSTCYKNFTIIADLSETTEQLMERIQT